MTQFARLANLKKLKLFNLQFQLTTTSLNNNTMKRESNLISAAFALSLSIFTATRTFTAFVPLLLLALYFAATHLGLFETGKGGRHFHQGTASSADETTHRPGTKRKMSVQSEAIAKRPLGSEVPQNTIVGISFFKHLPNEKLYEMRDYLEKKMALFPRLRSKITKVGESLVWEEVEKLDSDRHFVFHFDETTEKAILDGIDNEIVPRNFDADFPMFQWDFFQPTDTKERTVIVFAIHHSLADGYGVHRILNELMTGPNGEILDIFQPRPAAKQKSWWEWIKFVATGMLPRLKAQAKIYSLVLPVFRDTSTILTRYPYEIQNARRTVFLPALSLAKLSELRTKLQAKTNVKTTLTDLYLSMIGGAWHRYLVAHKDPMGNGSPQVRSWCPFMFHRDSATSYSLHNLWGFVSTKIVADGRSALDRLVATTKEFDSVKTSPEAVAQLDISGQILKINRWWTTFLKFIIFNAMSNQSMVFTSVPGLAREGWICGVPIDEIRCSITLLVPFFSLLSYNGRCFFSATIDPKNIDGDEFAQYMQEELAELGKLIGMTDFT